MPIHIPLVCSSLRRCSARVTLIASAVLIVTGCDSSTGPAEVTSVRVTPTTWSFTSIGLTAAGALYCWGRNEDRELGDGTAVNRAVPTRVIGSRP